DVEHHAVDREDADERHQAVDDVAEALLAARDQRALALAELAHDAEEGAAAGVAERRDGQLAPERRAVLAASLDALRAAHDAGGPGPEMAAELRLVLAAVGRGN